MNPQESEFIDRMGLVMERFGGTRTMGRLYAWLMICDPPYQSLTELAAQLGVSKTAISTIARQLETGGMIEHVPAQDRQHRYRIVPGGWTQVLRAQFAAVRPVRETLDFALEFVGEEPRGPRERLEEQRDFFVFLERDADEMLERWRQYRDKQHNDDRSDA
ncbi:DNA-binding transcriptional regulator GbsR, MarR family [Nonomuraea solani]|uniref:DNA-binding transcriptional regulator GbsR, MarR family n=2 Tax=Nonomuraea solani TaxID=1144553 RepID=A0A1H6EIQ3_9ACTN|nr:DNA-binding transcriptional regulator GbsR, MarR family [Nonomuraea solani]